MVSRDPWLLVLRASIYSVARFLLNWRWSGNTCREASRALSVRMCPLLPPARCRSDVSAKTRGYARLAGGASILSLLDECSRLFETLSLCPSFMLLQDHKVRCHLTVLPDRITFFSLLSRRQVRLASGRARFVRISFGSESSNVAFVDCSFVRVHVGSP